MADVFETVNDLVVKRFLDPVVGYQGDLPVVLDNDDLTQINFSEGFIYLSVVMQDAKPASINGANPKHRHVGQIQFQICVPVNEMTKKGSQEADLVAEVYRTKNFNGMLCYSPFTDRGKRVEYTQGKFWAVDGYCNFKYDTHIPL